MLNIRGVHLLWVYSSPISSLYYCVPFLIQVQDDRILWAVKKGLENVTGAAHYVVSLYLTLHYIHFLLILSM